MVSSKPFCDANKSTNKWLFKESNFWVHTAWKLLQVVHITKRILEKLLQMFELLFSGMVHVVDSVLSKSVWRCLPLKTSYKSTDQFHFASNIHWKLFQARVSHDSVIYKQKAITDKASSACVLTNKIKHILRLWKYQFINITKMAQSESINILTFDISVINLKL